MSGCESWRERPQDNEITRAGGIFAMKNYFKNNQIVGDEK